MTMLFNILFAWKCSSTHHKLALDALRHIQCERAEEWQAMFLSQVDRYLEGSKAPDDKFKDFRNHVLHVKDNYWGGAINAAEEWYRKTVDALKAQSWPDAAYSAGVLGHYFTDPFQPLHTAQSEAEGAVHRAIEWSIAKSYEDLTKILETELGGYPDYDKIEEPRWLAKMIRRGAERAYPHYDALIDHYDLEQGVKNPPAGLDDDLRRRIAPLIGHAVAGLGLVIECAIEDAGVQPPAVNLTLQTVFESMMVPIRWVTQRMADTAERDTVNAIYKEYQERGKVIDNLPEDDLTIRRLHAEEVLRVPLAELDEEKPRKPGSLHGVTSGKAKGEEKPRQEKDRADKDRQDREKKRVGKSIAAASLPARERDEDEDYEDKYDRDEPVSAKDYDADPAPRGTREERPIRDESERKARRERESSQEREQQQERELVRKTERERAADVEAERAGAADRVVDLLSKFGTEDERKAQRDAARREAKRGTTRPAIAKGSTDDESIRNSDDDQADAPRRRKSEPAPLVDRSSTAAPRRSRSIDDAPPPRLSRAPTSDDGDDENEDEVARPAKRPLRQSKVFEPPEQLPPPRPATRSAGSESRGRESKLTSNSPTPLRAASAGGGAARRPAKFHLERSAPVVDAPSIGPRTAAKLESVNIRTIGDLLDCDPSRVARQLASKQFDAATIRDWQDQTALVYRIPNLRGHDAQILVACGFRRVEQVAAARADDVLARSESYCATADGQRVIRSSPKPDLKEVQDWIAWAQSARGMKAA